MESVLRGAQKVFSSFSMTNKLEPRERKHMTKVYSSLTMASILAAAGAYVHLYYSIQFTGLAFFVGLGFLLAIQFSEHNQKNTTLRMGYLAGFALCSGLGMGPLIEYAIMLDPSIVVTALISTAFVFGSFSLSSVFAKNAGFLALAAPLSTLVTSLLWLSIANIFFGSKLLFQANLYLGLVAMCGFVLFDTTLIIEKSRMGDTDFIKHSVDLFIDLIGMFKRLLIILMQREENERRRRRD